MAGGGNGTPLDYDEVSNLTPHLDRRLYWCITLAQLHSKPTSGALRAGSRSQGFSRIVSVSSWIVSATCLSLSACSLLWCEQKSRSKPLAMVTRT